MNIEFIKIDDQKEKSEICNIVLNDLPLWFGIPESNRAYCEGVKKHDFIKIVSQDKLVGFCSVKENNINVAEIYVMGILEKYHRKGIGKQLFSFLEDELQKKSFLYLEVKTLDESRESYEYMKTRLFYKSVGFLPLDVLENEWGKDNPCLIMIKKL